MLSCGGEGVLAYWQFMTCSNFLGRQNTKHEQMLDEGVDMVINLLKCEHCAQDVLFLTGIAFARVYRWVYG